MDANKKIQQLLDEADSIFEKSYRETGLKILQGYKKALTEIKAKIAGMFETYGTYPTLTELRKYNRLQSLENQITEIIANMQRPIINTLHSEIKETAVTAYDNFGFVLSTATGLDFNFKTIPQESIDYILSNNLWQDRLKNHNAKLVVDIKDTLETSLQENAREEIGAGLAQGKSYSQVAKAIKERFDITATRAKGITFDQMHAAHSEGRNFGINKAMQSAEKLGLKGNKVWKHNAGAREPRQRHIAMNNIKADKDGNFHIGKLAFPSPGLSGDPAQDMYCHCTAQFELEGL
jgi:hypothetical protein